jgi:hypothetical protein
LITLRDYQQAAVNKAVDQIRAGKIAYLGMQTRTGKTLTALSIAARHHAGELTTVLFLTKKKAISSVEADYKAGGFKYRLTVTNYEQAEKLEPVFDIVIIDEAHNFGAYPKPSLRTKNVKRLCRNIPVIFLSATPTPESYSQIYHQLWLSDFSPFKQYKNFYAWFKDYGIPGKKKINATQEINDYSKTKPELQIILNELFITVTQQQAGFTQQIDEKFHKIEMENFTVNLFKGLNKDRICYPTINNIVTADTPAKLLTKGHQISSGTVIDDNGEYVIIDPSKVEYLFQTFAGQKFAIFYKFQSEFDLIKEYAKKHRFDLADNPEQFNDSANHVIYASQIQSGREGVNLRAADCLVMLNIDFASVSYWQAINRLQSQKRDKPAVIHWLFSNTGLEERIYKTVAAKKDFTTTVFKRAFLSA